MKNLLTFLFFVLIVTSGFGKNTNEKLPEIPWRAISETCNYESFNQWSGEVNVKLFGNYDSTDVEMIENSIRELNPLLETIHLVFSDYDRGNIEIYFLDSTNIKKYGSIIILRAGDKCSWRSSFNSTIEGRKTTLFTLALNTGLVATEHQQRFITNNLAFSLYPYIWDDYKYDKNGFSTEGLQPSLFRSIEVNQREQLFYGELPAFDKTLLKAVYAPDFKEKLAVAHKQYKRFLISARLQNYTDSFLLLPFGVLFLLLLWIFLKISKAIAERISNRFIRFNLNGIVGLFLLVTIAGGYFAVSDAIRWHRMINLRYALVDFGGICLIVTAIGLPAINLLRFVEKFIHRNTHKKVLKTVLIFLSTGLIPYCAFVAIAYFSDRESFSNPNRDMIKMLSYLFIGSMVVATFRALIGYFIFKEKDLIIENETKLIQLRELKTKAELNALHSRINPHFLYNSLNSIAGLAHTNANQTEHMALSLSKLFRYSINKEKSDWTTFREELEMVRIYLDVEKVRFADRLVYSIEIAEELKESKIPRFIIQPLAENAVKHGISQSVEGGEIKIKIQKEKKDILITVADSGKEFPLDLTPGFGLQSIYDKLEILYGDKFELSFTNSPEKQVSLKLK